jgi:hypothetical protein
MGLHSVMLKPDSVRRVIPPTTMMAKTRVDDTMSHIPTGRGGNTGSGSSAAGLLLAEKKRVRGSRKVVHCAKGVVRMEFCLQDRVKSLARTVIADLCIWLGVGARKANDLNRRAGTYGECDGLWAAHLRNAALSIRMSDGTAPMSWA